jgi:penicillin-binding protein 1C
MFRNWHFELKKKGGDIIHTTIDLNTQLKIEKLVKDYSRTLALKNIRNAAVIVLDNRTHQVVSYVGSADFHDSVDGGQVNGAMAVREPGQYAEAVAVWAGYRCRVS